MKIPAKTFVKTPAKALAAAAVTVLTALSLAASAPAPGSPAAASPPKHPACFWTHSISSFAAGSDDETLYLKVGVKDVYELKLFNNCFDIGWVQHIALRSRFSSNICEGTGNNAEVYVPGGAFRERCPVTDIRKLTPDEVAALPKNSRP